MSEKEYITIQDDAGNEKVFQVDALFDMEEDTFAMITSGDETRVMRLVDGIGDGDQTLISATDEEIENLIDAYNIAIHASEDEEPLSH